MTDRYRKIMCPDSQDGVHYRLSNPATGEIRETDDLALLLRCIADDAILAGLAQGWLGDSMTLTLERFKETAE